MNRRTSLIFGSAAWLAVVGCLLSLAPMTGVRMPVWLALPVEPEPENESNSSGTETAHLKTYALRNALDSSRRGGHTRGQRRAAALHLLGGMSLTATLLSHSASPAPAAHGHSSAPPTPLRC
jgi:hypothetical protein